MSEKVYKCQKCGQIFKEDKPIRLCEYKYNFSHGYKQYKYTTKKYDLCERCYVIFKKWVKKQVIK